MQNQQSHRKDEHVSLAKKFHKQNSEAGFDQVHFIPNALPEMGVNDVDFSTEFNGIKMPVPFYIEAMTGGSEYTKNLNEKLATIAKETGLAMATGSESVALKDPNLSASFSITREINPDGLIFANIGADTSLESAKRAINIINADALEIHLNVVQELTMAEGQRDFSNWSNNIREIAANVNVPVIAKEVGFGLSKESILELRKLGIKTVNVGGSGGTNFAQIENFRREKKEMTYLEDWGISTVESLVEASQVSGVNVLAAGGITNPMEIVKALFLGANAVGIASAILVNLIDNGIESTIELISNWKTGVKTIFCALGVRNITELRKAPVVYGVELENYLKQRK